jgi:hypothetical protein
MDTMMMMWGAGICAVLLVCCIVFFIWQQQKKSSKDPDPVVLPTAEYKALDRLDEAVKGKPVSAALETVRTSMPGWKTKVFDADRPTFEKEYDAWDLTGSTPNTVVILADTKGNVYSLTFGPTGGAGMTSPGMALSER